jgi:diacylglycerol kinase family enzyme
LRSGTARAFVVIAVFVNPRSGACRRDPGLPSRFARLVEPAGRVITPGTFEDLDQEASALAASPPAAVAIHGGDGTLHRVLTALLRAWGERRLPPIAILSGGTMNVVVNSLGIGTPADTLLPRLAAAVARPAPLPVLMRRCLIIGDRFGFVFGNGFVADFLTEYYNQEGYGRARAVEMLSRLLPSTLFGGELAGRVFRGFTGRVVVDGQELPYRRLSAISAGTVKEVGLRFKLNHRADDDPERFSVLAIHAGALALLTDVAAVYAGRGISEKHAFSALAKRLEIASDYDDMPYTIDGDLYRAKTLTVAIGPQLEIVDPHRLPAHETSHA